MLRRLNPSWVFGALSAALSAGYGVLFTVVGDFRDQYGISETAIGVVIGVGFLAAFVAQVFIAPVADRGRARQLIVIGVIANVVGLLMMGFGESLGPILAGRIISGIGIGGASPAIKRIVILADPDNLGQNLGRLLSADVFGFAMGPAISAVLAGPVGLAAPFVVVAAITAAILPATFFVSANETTDAPRQRLAVDLLRSRVVAGAVVLGATSFLMIGAFDALWDVVHEDLDTPTWMANLGITLFAVPLVILGPTGGRIAQRVGPFRIAAAGLVAGALFMYSYGQLPTGTWIFAFSLFHATTDGLTISAAGVAIAIAVSEERQAGAQGMMGAAQSLFAGFTAIAVGALYDGSGRATAYSAAAIGMIVMVIIGMTLAVDFWRSEMRPTTTPADIEPPLPYS
ncbi:MAG: MFS transporter [Acidimicrobiia bacterium]|nr:MFS transporter [Acidimicrobiia bacterium]